MNSHEEPPLPPPIYPSFIPPLHGHDGAPKRTPGVIQMAMIWLRHAHMRYQTHKREMLLEPNRGSQTKIERYVFGIQSDPFLFGGSFGQLLTGMGPICPTVCFRPQKWSTNAPTPGFVYIDNILTSNVSCTIGQTIDAFGELDLDLPTLSTANKVSITACYSGFVPPGYESFDRATVMKGKPSRGPKVVAKRGQKLSDVPGYVKPAPYSRPKFIFCVSMTGPATIIG